MRSNSIPTKLYGPCEYIADLNLEDFRKLGQNTEERIEKLKEKIKEAGKRSFELKIKAIQAFKKSEFFRLYLEIGKEALNQKKTIQQIIEEEKNKTDLCLTKEEFKEIIELSKKLEEPDSL